MKLKKIASLMLAGIMAVSMLAGCKDAASSSTPTQPEVPTGTVADVIAAIDSDKVDFTSDSSLQNLLNKLAKNAGSTTGDIDVDALIAANPSIRNCQYIPATANVNLVDTEDNDKVEQTAIFVVSVGNAVDDEFVAQNLASQIKAEGVYNNGAGNIGDLPEKTLVDADNEYYYTFDYTGKIAVAEIENAVTGATSYVAVFTITRTPTKVEL